MTLSKSGVSPSYIFACVSAPGGGVSDAVLPRGNDVERRLRVVGDARARRRREHKRAHCDHSRHEPPHQLLLSLANRSAVPGRSLA